MLSCKLVIWVGCVPFVIVVVVFFDNFAICDSVVINCWIFLILNVLIELIPLIKSVHKYFLLEINVECLMLNISNFDNKPEFDNTIWKDFEPSGLCLYMTENIFFGNDRKIYDF